MLDPLNAYTGRSDLRFFGALGEGSAVWNGTCRGASPIPDAPDERPEHDSGNFLVPFVAMEAMDHSSVSGTGWTLAERSTSLCYVYHQPNCGTSEQVQMAYEKTCVMCGFHVADG
jgi:hypothetical protein